MSVSRNIQIKTSYSGNFLLFSYLSLLSFLYFSFFVPMAYQSSLVIHCQSNPGRRTTVILFYSELVEIEMFTSKITVEREFDTTVQHISYFTKGTLPSLHDLVFILNHYQGNASMWFCIVFIIFNFEMKRKNEKTNSILLPLVVFCF